MARSNKVGKPVFSPVKREIFAILFLAVGIFLYLSLFSYSPLDPSFFNHTTTGVTHNWGGVVGSCLADSLLFLFGGGAYFMGFFFLLLAVLFFTGVRHHFGLYEIFLYLIFVIFISVLFQLGRSTLVFGEFRLEAGGFFGSILGRAGLDYLGRPGAWLVVFFGALLTFVWATRLSLMELGRVFGRFASPVFSWMTRHLSVHYARLKKIFAKWLEDRKSARGKAPPLPELKINRQHSTFLPPLPSSPVSLPVQLASSADHDGEPKILERADRKRAKFSSQLEFQNLGGDYKLPPINLLDSESQEHVVVDEESLKMNARILEKKLLDFSVEGKVTEIHPGPVITMYEFEPAPGVKLSRIANLVDDLCLAMGGRSVRIVAPLPNKPAVGIEIPNNARETVWLKDIVADEKFRSNDSKLVMALGKDIEGIPFVADLSKMPHLLVAGATGSGKSVSINSMILSFLYKARPEEVRMIMVDPKMLELSIYEGIPHLLLPVVTEPKKAALALRWAVREMERRYKLLADINARHILNYNRKIEKGNFVGKQSMLADGAGEASEADLIRHEGKLPYIVIIIDELADLMMVSSRDVEECITRLAQMARAAGIHLVLATQRPSVDVLTGVIKANFPARISFKVSSKHDSRTVLDTIGSERLLGNGDMLFVPPGASKMIRVHGAYITESEVGRIVDFLKKQAKPVYNESILEIAEAEALEGVADEDLDSLYDQAVAIVAETRQASISMIQRKLRVGYNRAARMIEKMETDGIVSPPTSAGQRQVLVSSFQTQ